ncbi:MAG: hypothetical protein JO261_05695, partial [Alphaproteobacteria bacterium]|nr:hypothetical protein [Alphaproteobacteria bacterium]
PDGSETVLHAFTGGADGYAPTGGVVADGAGNLYGNTLFGGATACGEGCGTIYRIAPDGTETILHTFTGSADDGAYPLGTLLIDRKGNIYGTTSKGGSAQDYGTVFGLSKNGAEKILYVFQGGSDGEYPEAGLVRDRTGNLFGTTASGGSYQGGTAFKLAPDGTETILHSFSTLDSDMPLPGGGALVLDGHGNLFGTCVGTHSGSRGIVFELLPGGTEQVLHVFSKAKGHDPAGGLTARNGRLFGTTLQGGPSNMGVVYALHE